MYFLDLPCHIHTQIFSYLTQVDKVHLSRTCKEFSRVCKDSLYRNVYITERTFPIQEAYSYFESQYCGAVNSAFHEWTIVRSGLNADSSIRLLERTLQDSSENHGKIETLLCDDITFVLFKLNSWSRRFGLSSSLRRIYFGNIPLNHLVTVYDDLLKFYLREPHLRLNYLQLTSFDDLVKFSDLSSSRLTGISFYLCDIRSLEVPALSSAKRRDILECFQFLTTLEVVSVQNLSMTFLENVYQALRGETDDAEGVLLPHCTKLSLNHTHGQVFSSGLYNFSNNYDSANEKELDVFALKKVFNLGRLRDLKLQIGCTHIYKGYEAILDVSLNENKCSCLHNFLGSLDVNNIERFKIIRDGQSINENLNAVFHFREELSTFFKRGAFHRLKLLSIEVTRDIISYGDYTPQEIWEACRSLERQTWGYFHSLKHIKLLRVLQLPDYYQSHTVLRMYENYYINGIFLDLEHCNSCRETAKFFKNFLQANEKIQFYLHPLNAKSKDWQDNYFELVRVIFEIFNEDSGKDSYVKTSSISGAMSLESLKPSKFIPGGDFFEIMKLVNNDSTPWRNKEISLHSIFRHDSYKELVYNFVTNLSRVSTNTEEREKLNPFEIKCKCKGDELIKFIHYLRHQIVPDATFHAYNYDIIFNSIRRK